MRRLAIVLAVSTVALVATVGATSARTDKSVVSTGVGFDAATACRGVTLRFIGLAGEEGSAQLKPWLKSVGMKIQITNIGNWGQQTAAIKVGQPYDLGSLTYSQAKDQIAAKIWQPINFASVPAWKTFAPALRNSRLIRAGGKLYGTPLYWGDSPYVYDPAHVSTLPSSILDLGTAAWKGRFLIDDNPNWLFTLVAYAKGYTRAPLLTPAQLDAVSTATKPIVANAAAFAQNFRDATDRLVAGDAALTFNGWQAQLVWAQDKGGKLAFGFWKEDPGGGWWDGIGIPATAKRADCALAYIAKLMSARVNGRVAGSLISGAANLAARPYVVQSARLYDYKKVIRPLPRAFQNFQPPLKAPQGYTDQNDWQAAWTAIKG